ncbi:hypothetical protein CAPTEDRAFT_191249 [Capitella teleta]|uniref:G-protein coupled receptors family 1 profile domain-containing protein n=1 Tax=Capitella teleta TaxID=283909 RepID=R7TMR3_CAPTE|nr:hypothetical protein CAPTEDRAFT_191249 [Capitella teleta]|eukprot:ELT92370.1 hypothetical protein CAPTEDRAFT_191249 [Capitella teleta]
MRHSTEIPFTEVTIWGITETRTPSNLFGKIYYSLVVFVGLVGNTLNLVILSKRNLTLFSSTVYLIGLACADILVLIFQTTLKYVVYKSWVVTGPHEFMNFVCVYNNWILIGAVRASFWITVGFTIERYIAIAHPLWGKRWCTVSRAKGLRSKMNGRDCSSSGDDVTKYKINRHLKIFEASAAIRRRASNNNKIARSQLDQRLRYLNKMAAVARAKQQRSFDVAMETLKRIDAHRTVLQTMFKCCDFNFMYHTQANHRQHLPAIHVKICNSGFTNKTLRSYVDKVMKERDLCYHGRQQRARMLEVLLLRSKQPFDIDRNASFSTVIANHANYVQRN